MTPAEIRAVKRLARAERKTVAAVFRSRVIEPALLFDPMQGLFDAMLAPDKGRR